VGVGVAIAVGRVEFGESVAAVVEHAVSAVAMMAVPNKRASFEALGDVMEKNLLDVVALHIAASRRRLARAVRVELAPTHPSH
jgi:hypothetical protein